MRRIDDVARDRIRDLHTREKMKQNALARRFGITSRTVRTILRESQSNGKRTRRR